MLVIFCKNGMFDLKYQLILDQNVNCLIRNEIFIRNLQLTSIKDLHIQILQTQTDQFFQWFF